MKRGWTFLSILSPTILKLTQLDGKALHGAGVEVLQGTSVDPLGVERVGTASSCVAT